MSQDFWQHVKPSVLGANRPEWMTFDDEWVDEVSRGVKACKVFLWYPLYCERVALIGRPMLTHVQGSHTTK